VAVQGLEFALKALASAGVKVIDPIIPASGLLSEISGDKGEQTYFESYLKPTASQ